MKCPLCGEKMEKGGIYYGGRSPSFLTWYPAKELAKRGLRAWSRENGRELLDEACLLGSIFEEAYYCSTCDKVIGVFDVRKD